MAGKHKNGQHKKRTYSQVFSIISTYKPRRERARTLYGCHSNEYRGLHSKYSAAMASLKRIKNRNDKMRDLEDRLLEFMGYKVRDILPKDRLREKLLCRWIFCKWCIERGISGYDIAIFLGCHKDRPASCRATFTKSFKTNKENLEMWRRFKLFMKDYKDISND